MNLKYIKENNALSSEDLHSSYLFYTMALDYCLKKLERIENVVSKWSIENTDTVIASPLEDCCKVLEILQEE